MTTYTITLTATQAATISHACEVLARLGMGQYTDALECLPTKELCPDGWHEDMQAIGHILSKHANVHGLRYSQKHEARRTAMSNVAWDVYQVTRHRLAWDRRLNLRIMSPHFKSWRCTMANWNLWHSAVTKYRKFMVLRRLAEISPLLKRELETWLKNPRVSSGLCGCVSRPSELRQLFAEDGLDIAFPFNVNAKHFDQECLANKAHLNPKRVAWVKKTLGVSHVPKT